MEHLAAIIRRMVLKHDEISDSTDKALSELLSLLKESKRSVEGAYDPQWQQELLKRMKVSAQSALHSPRSACMVIFPQNVALLCTVSEVAGFPRVHRKRDVLFLQKGEFTQRIKDASYAGYNAVSRLGKKIDEVAHDDISAACRRVEMDTETLNRVVTEVRAWDRRNGESIH